MSNQPSAELDGDLKVNIQSFPRHLNAENKSPATVCTSIEAAKLFDEFLGLHGYTRLLAGIRAEHVELFITTQLNLRAAAAAANRYRSLQAFFKWALAEGEIEEENDPFRNLKSPSVPEKHVRLISEEEIKKLLKACTGTGFNERRHHRDSMNSLVNEFKPDSGINLTEPAGVRQSIDNPWICCETEDVERTWV